MKKPIVIEAEQFLGTTSPLPFSGRGDPCYLDDGRWYILTLESDHSLTLGDWVIRGVKGEFYLCKPDIFAATYDTVDDPPAAFKDCAAKDVMWRGEEASNDEA